MDKRLVYIAGLSGDESIGSYVKQDMINMKSIFETYENEGQIILRTDEFATKDSVINRFRDTKVLPWLFYFSGHSDDNNIQLSDGMVPAHIFANIFNEKKILEALQLVYLGSCKSNSIGNQLIDKQVELVIVSNKKVETHLANLVSKLFFNRFFFSENILSAFEMTKNDYMFDRINLLVNQNVDFPWELLTSNETNLKKPLKKLNLSAVQGHQIVMNAASIRLEFLNFYLINDASSNKNTKLIKEEAAFIKTKLDTSLKMVNEQENIKSLVNVWKDIPQIDLLPHNELFLDYSSEIKDLKLMGNFEHKTRNQISNMLNISDEILMY